MVYYPMTPWTGLTEWKNIKGKPYVTVSAKGIANGLSDIPNDGADFGPDTTLGATSPNQIGSPYTQTSGIQEAADYVNQNGGGIVKLGIGLFLIDTNINGSNWNGVTIEGSGSIITSVGVLNQFSTAGGTVIAPSNNWSPTKYFSYNLPTKPSNNYYPLIYVVGNGANSPAATGTNLQFKNMILSGAIGGKTNRTPTAAGLYVHGIWNCVIDHVDTQNCTIGHYANLNGPSGNSWWIANSTHIAPSVLGGYYHIDEGLIYALDCEACTYAFDIGGNGTDIPMTVIGLTWDAGTTFTGNVNCIGCFNDAQANNGPVVEVSYNSVFVGCIFTQRDNANGNPIVAPVTGITPKSVLFQSCTFIPSASTTNPTPLVSGQFNASGFNPPSIKFKDCILTPPPGSVWASNLFQTYSVSGYVSGIVAENLIGVTLPAPTTPTVPASGTALMNTNPYSVKVYISGGSITAITITRNGTNYTVFSASTAQAVYDVYDLDPGDSITLTYTTAPSWTWYAKDTPVIISLPSSSTSGTTAGTVSMQTASYTPNYKKYVITFSGYENDTTTNQTINFPAPFTNYAIITGNNTGLTISASTTGITITSPNSTTTYSGIVIVEGY